MALDVTGLDHICLAVRDFGTSESFYDGVMELLGFKKGDAPIGGEPHAHYFNRHLQLSIRPARSEEPHDPYAAGLHHICLRLADDDAVDTAALELRTLGVKVRDPKVHTEYSEDYYAIFFEDPDGIRLERVGRLRIREEIIEQWDRLEGFLNPMQRLQNQEETPEG